MIVIPSEVQRSVGNLFISSSQGMKRSNNASDRLLRQTKTWLKGKNPHLPRNDEKEVASFRLDWKGMPESHSKQDIVFLMLFDGPKTIQKGLPPCRFSENCNGYLIVHLTGGLAKAYQYLNMKWPNWQVGQEVSSSDRRHIHRTITSFPAQCNEALGISMSNRLLRQTKTWLKGKNPHLPCNDGKSISHSGWTERECRNLF